MANVSHELRTPLTRLQLAVALLEDQLNTQSENNINNVNTDSANINSANINSANIKHLSRIENEIVKMDQMIGQVLTLAKINASMQRVDLQQTTLTALLNDVLQDAQFEADAMNKSLFVNIIPEVSIKADMILLTSAIENVLRNAIRFAVNEVSCELNIAAHNLATDFVEIVINDDGVGMSAAELKTVFDPFFRGSHQVHEASKGAGLGLSIAKAAIEMHGGSIQVKARFNKDISQAHIQDSKRSCSEQSPLTGLSVIIRLPIFSKTS
jgi:two-component system sensor histidine kinase CpxA